MAVKAILQHDDISTSMIYIHDVEDELQKGISPLALVAERVSDNMKVKQLPMGKSDEIEGEIEGEIVEVSDAGDVVDDLVLEMFPEVSGGVKIRPLLNAEDLELIRRGFLAMYDSGKYDADIGKARELMKRMTRKVR
jgi:hypothetical protein